MTYNGYSEPHDVGIKVRADMLESVAGFGTERFEREYHFAVAAADFNDVDGLRWLAAIAARRIAELDYLADES